VLVGTVDANQIVVSPQIQGRILKLLVEEGSQVKQGDLIALLDPSELEAEERAAAATIASLRSKVNANEYTRQSTKGSTSSDVANSQAQAGGGAGATGAGGSHFDTGGERQPADDWLGAGGSGIGSGPGAGGDESEGAAGERAVAEGSGNGGAGGFDSALARTNQATAAQSTVESTRAQVDNAVAAAEGSGSAAGIHQDLCAGDGNGAGARGARRRSGECRTGDRDGGGFQRHVGVRAIPETEADHIGLGDTLRVRLPGGTVVPGKVFYKAAEADFATQRDVGRRKRDIRTIALKVRLDNPKGAYVPGMTAEVLVSPEQLKGDRQSAEQAANHE
jgi:HlyD family secretion protein